jgi:hypothetical protein
LDPIHLLLGLAVFVVSSVGGLLVVGLILVRIPADYFSEKRGRNFLRGRHPMLRATGVVLKNVAGIVLVVVGFVLSLPGVPGPGFLTIFIGIMLLDFPGKTRLERWLVCRPPILRPVNRLRKKRGKPPLVVDWECAARGRGV